MLTGSTDRCLKMWLARLASSLFMSGMALVTPPAWGAASEAVSPVFPPEVGLTLKNGWTLVSVQWEKDTDLFLNLESREGVRRLGLWLVARNDRSPFLFQTERFNVAAVFYDPPFSLTEDERTAVDELAVLIRAGEGNGPFLTEKTNPELLYPGYSDPPLSISSKTAVRAMLAAVGLLILSLSVACLRSLSVPAWTKYWGWGVGVLVLTVAVGSRYRALGGSWDNVGLDETRIGLTAEAVLQERSLILNYGAAAETTLSAYATLPFAALVADPVQTLKLAGATLNALAVFFVFLAGKRLGGLSIGVAAASGMAVSALTLAYAQVMTEYVLASTLAAATLWTFAWRREKPAQTRSFLLGVCLGLGICAKLAFAPFAAGLVAGILVEGIGGRRAFLSAIATGLLVGLSPLLMYAGLDWHRYSTEISVLVSRDPSLTEGGYGARFLAQASSWLGPALLAAGASCTGLLILGPRGLPVFPLCGSAAAAVLALAFLPKDPDLRRLLIPAPSVFLLAALPLGHEVVGKKRSLPLVATLITLAILWKGMETNVLPGRPIWGWRRMETGVPPDLVEAMKTIPPSVSVHSPGALAYPHYYLWAPREMPPLNDCDRLNWPRGAVPCKEFLGAGPDLWYRQHGRWTDLNLETQLTELIKERLDRSRMKHWIFRLRPTEAGEVSPVVAHKALRRALDELDIAYTETAFSTPIREYCVVSLAEH